MALSIATDSQEKFDMAVIASVISASLYILSHHQVAMYTVLLLVSYNYNSPT